MSQNVYVGMSGGVDSSVAAALLLEQGYSVTGVYMKNWSQDLPGFTCPWKEDYQDAKRVAVQLDIPFKMYDFETEYRQRVVDYMLEGYQAGITPNPDIMCNQEIKFKLFLETALHDGADMIATGHYARVVDGQLLTGLDSNKDQSYFLYRVTENALRHSLMPIGTLEKPYVREVARKLGLSTAEKKDSQGICFVGKVGIKDFLLAELGPQKPGVVIDTAGRELGQHEGALFYTIGQRHGLDIGGGLPYYVIGKDMSKNEVYVTTDLQDERLWRRELDLVSVHWINGEPVKLDELEVRTRYRAPLVKCSLNTTNTSVHLVLKGDTRAITPGQSAVIYDGERCLGGGIVI
jgi:tRNA-specific 2-thiouridylase